MKKQNNKWSLDPADVQMYGGSFNASGRKKATHSRELDTTSLEWNLVHVPTGIKVNGEVSAGNDIRKEMKKREDTLLQKLFIELERNVAKELRVPGYA